MNSRERVHRTIEFSSPDRVPVYCFNKDFDKSDILCFDIKNDINFKPKTVGETEWGYKWIKLDGTMGQPKEEVITDYEQLSQYIAPNPLAKGRFDGLDELRLNNSDKYIMVGPDITGYTIVTFIRGFENTLTDLYVDEENINKIIDIVFDYEDKLIEEACSHDIDAFSFHDDWGTQNACIISPEKWREVFKPRYKKQFDILHKHNKHVFFHSCGYVYDIIPDLIEIGVDILNFNQPDVMGLDKLSCFKGRVCFNCPVDLQKVALKATKQQIYSYTNKLYSSFNNGKGGFIGYVEEYKSIGLSDENYQYCLNALKAL